MEDKLMAGGAEQSVQDLVEQRKIRQVRVCVCVEAVRWAPPVEAVGT
jgi:hypothetical protein